MTQTLEKGPVDERQERDFSLWFWAAGALLFLLNLAFGFLRVAPTAALVLSILSGVIFVAAPLLGLFAAGSSKWTWVKSLAFLALGVGLHLGSVLVTRQIGPGAPAVLLQSAGQFGILIWCAGLGAAIALIIKDKNLILPVCLFLAGFDAFLILSPSTPVSQMVASNSQAFTDVAMKVPQAQVTPRPDAKPEDKRPKIVPAAYIGPADLLFSMAFFVLLFRFRMEVRKTAAWLAPVLVLYLVLALATPWGMLPALVPIGATVLIVNRRHFEMTKDEKLGTWVVGLIAVALAAWGIYQRATYVPPIPPQKPGAPSNEGRTAESPLGAGSLQPESPGQSQS